MDLDEAQKLAQEISRSIGKRHSPFVIVTDILEEAGEVAATVKGMHGMKQRRPKQGDLGKELSDLMYSIFWLANHYKIRLNDHYRRKIMGYLKRYK